LRPGDTVTFTGKVSAVVREPNGGRVTVEITATNQKGDVTAAGSGACIVPSGSIPEEA
jgi:acyl dehydratase